MLCVSLNALQTDARTSQVLNFKVLKMEEEGGLIAESNCSKSLFEFQSQNLRVWYQNAYLLFISVLYTKEKKHGGSSCLELYSREDILTRHTQTTESHSANNKRVNDSLKVLQLLLLFESDIWVHSYSSFK